VASLETFLITGVSRGLGAGFFGELTSVRPHAMIVAVGRSFSEAQGAAAAHEPDSIKLIHADLSQTPDWRDLHFVGQLTGKLTVILNAGIVAPIGVVGTVDYSDLQRCHHINFLSQANLCDELLKLYQGDALSIVNISSGAANHTIAGWSAYCAAKAAMKMYLDCVAVEHPGVQVKHIDPGVMDTDMQKDIRAVAPESFPVSEQFHQLKQDGKLVSADVRAVEILQDIGVAL
jgi:benzil reductase ((S)-benzoin forming)